MKGRWALTRGVNGFSSATGVVRERIWLSSSVAGKSNINSEGKGGNGPESTIAQQVEVSKKEGQESENKDPWAGISEEDRRLLDPTSDPNYRAKLVARAASAFGMFLVFMGVMNLVESSWKKDLEEKKQKEKEPKFSIFVPQTVPSTQGTQTTTAPSVVQAIRHKPPSVDSPAAPSEQQDASSIRIGPLQSIASNSSAGEPSQTISVFQLREDVVDSPLSALDEMLLTVRSQGLAIYAAQ